jgi:hypothetical protein
MDKWGSVHCEWESGYYCAIMKQKRVNPMPEKEPTTKKSTPKKTTKKEPQLKISESEKQSFPYTQFPVKVIHKDGKELKDTKICYFQNENHAQKYITRCKFKKTDYQIFVKPNQK